MGINASLIKIITSTRALGFDNDPHNVCPNKSATWLFKKSLFGAKCSYYALQYRQLVERREVADETLISG